MSRVTLLVALLLVPAYAEAQCGGGFFGRARVSRSYSGSDGCGSYSTYSSGCGSVYSYDGCGDSYNGCVITSRGTDFSGSGCEIDTRTEPEKSSPIRTDQPNDLPNTPLPAAPKYPSELDAMPPTNPIVSTTVKKISHQVAVKGRGTIVLNVPVMAQVWINDRLTTSTGQHRQYSSVELVEGRQYSYHIVVRDGNQQAVRDVVLRSGQTLNVR